MNRFIEDYAEIKKMNPAGIRNWLRSGALDILYAVNSARNMLNDFIERPRIQFLYIHHIFRDEESQLVSLLKTLQEKHHFISYSEAVERLFTGNIDKPYIVISSDDGFRNNLRAAEILAEFNAPSCFFICPGVIDHIDTDYLSHFAAEKLHFPPVEFLGWKDVERIIALGHEIGGHTMHHADLGEISGSELQSEISECFRLLKPYGEKLHFAFPYGRFKNITPDARNLIFTEGFHSCASAERGCYLNGLNENERSSHLIRRDHIILDWPIEHITYFMANNVRFALKKGDPR